MKENRMNKNIHRFCKLAAWGATLALAAGCTTDNYYQNPPSGGGSNASQAAMPVVNFPMSTQPKETPGATSEATNGVVADSSGGHAAWNEDRTSLKSETVYFAFDKSAIKSREQSKLDDVADFLKRNPKISIRIEGNCDERGTEEFNRELGVRRAEAARDDLVRLGIDSTRIQTLSRGKDNPAVTGEGGESRSLNRRDEFVVLISNQAI
jgi:outer membrane protein OmpA-like peptidoglycan-associated protein